MAISSFDGRYVFLSNFYHSPIQVGGVNYPTVEHAYQAAKTLDEDQKQKIRNAKTPGEAKRIGKAVTLRPNWNKDLRVSTMRTLLITKFQDPELKKMLIATGSEELIEGNWWGDRFWGVCKGTGANRLGKLLMEIRDNINNMW